MAEERADLKFHAWMAEQTERYDDLAKFMRKIMQIDVNLTSEERNLLSKAYKNIIQAHRSSWRVISSLEGKEEGKEEVNERRKNLVNEYKRKVESELSTICQDVISFLEDYVLPNVHKTEDTTELKVFYLKMIGDYYRYLADLESDASLKKKGTQKAEESYEKATEAGKKLPKVNPIYLGLALTFSVFYYEIMNAPDKACELAQSAFESAVAELQNVKPEWYKESTQMMQLLRDKLTLWTSVQEDNDNEK